MMRLPLSALAAVADGRLSGADPELVGMIHDARLAWPGSLFCALPGEHHDGHEFIAQARSRGAAAALVSRWVDDALPQLLVADVIQAMGRIASAWRKRLNLRLAGVTGSNGKTTVKNMLAAILSSQAPTLATEGNYNNDLGVPLTLSRLDETHRFAVIEMGANHPDDIARLAELAGPDVGVVTNAAAAHLEGFGNVAGVARAKGRIFQALPDNGVAVINADDPHSRLWHDMAGERRIISFALNPAAEVSAEWRKGEVLVHTPAGRLELRPPLPGRHNLANALAAIAAALALDVPLERIGPALERMQAPPARLQIHHLASGWCLIDDSYNANPASLRAALEVLSEMEGESWLVLGDMGELGPETERLHAGAGTLARQIGVSRLFTLGPLAALAARSFGSGAEHFDSHQALTGAVAAAVRPGVNCLVKGSRSMRLERVVAELLGEPEPC